MSEPRERLVDDGDPPERPLDVADGIRTVAAHQAALAALLPERYEIYRRLKARYAAEGSSPELRASALEGANDLGLLLQELRRRDAIVLALREADDVPSIPFFPLESLYTVLLLLAGDVTSRDADILWDPDELAPVYFGPGPTLDWLTFNGHGTDPRA